GHHARRESRRHDSRQRLKSMGQGSRMNEQRVGEPVDTRPAERPQRIPLTGRYVDVVPALAAAHGGDLHAAATGPGTEMIWTYLSVGPWRDRASLDAWLQAAE